MRVLQVDIVHRRTPPRPYTLYSITSPLLPTFANTTRVAVLTKSAVHTGSIFLAIAYDMSSGEAAEGGGEEDLNSLQDVMRESMSRMESL